MIGAEPVVRRRRLISPVWLLPALALLLAIGFLYQQYQQAGQLIHINFEQGNGILPGKTQLRYQGVSIGMVTDLNLAQDGRRVAVTVKVERQAMPLVRKGSQFWLVSPKASLTEISGLDTLVSGNYIALMPGRDGAPAVDRFDALDGPPPGWQAQGRIVHLQSDTLGSVGNGTKVYYRGLEVGSVINTRLADDDTHVRLDVMIDTRFAHLVRESSRFWSTGGVRGSLGADGLKVEVGNLASVLGGGITFDAPTDAKPADVDTLFSLYPNMAAAERGHRINLNVGELPVREGMSIVFDGIEIGRVLPITLDKSGRHVAALIADEQRFRITSNSVLVMEGVDLSLSGIQHAERLLSGPVLRLESRGGAPVDELKVLSNAPRAGVTVTLAAADLSGLKEGAPVWFKGLSVGQVDALKLSARGEASVQLLMYEPYRNLLQGARFYKRSPLSVKADLSGVQVDTAPASGWIDGGISLLTQTGSRMDTLFPSEELARLARPGNQPLRWTLTAQQADGLAVGAPLLYRGLEAGRITELSPATDGVSIALEINALYAPLIGEHTRFWRLSAVDAQLGADGVKVRMGNLANLLRGGIEFANDPQALRSNRQLFADRKEATTPSRELLLTSDSNPGLGEGAPLRYRGVTIGKVVAVTLSKGLDQVQIKAQLDEPYAASFLRRGAGYQLVLAKLGLSGVNHLDTLIKGPYIEATPGTGAAIQRFALQSGPANGLDLVLTSHELNGVSVGTPILFRKVVVGEVAAVELAADGSEVQTRITIAPRYAHLVRSGSRFWNVSGLKADVGLTGGTIEVATIQSLLAGGIAFNTPDKEPGALVRSGQRFVLNSEPQKEWQAWDPTLKP